MKSIKEKFDALWEVVESGCWEWQGGFYNVGYGQFFNGGVLGKKQIGAHRAAWILYRGEIPSGLHVCHHCDNKKCVNPDHLFIGMHADNMRDMQIKGLRKPARGSTHGSSKLNEAQAREILISNETLRILAQRFSVHHSIIGKIKQRKIWKHI